MSQPCGCCAGIQIITPETEANPPGMSALNYRVGTYATFYETMLARLSTLCLNIPSTDGSPARQQVYPLKQLTTREASDPSIALLDAWAVVADVLTFYQERIANEGYLATATERRSLLELARLVSYTLRPGVSASVYLAFTVQKGFSGTIPAGTRAQSIPGSGQMPQFFETSSDLAVRDVWNDLGVRLTRPQVITFASDPGTDAATRETLYLQGISTNLKVGDSLLIVRGGGASQQKLRLVQSVDAQADQNRTQVALQEAAPQAGATIADVVNPFIDEASSIFAGSDLATEVAQILNNLKTGALSLSAAIPEIQEKHDIAVKREFTRLEVWTSDLLDALNSLVGTPAASAAAGAAVVGRGGVGGPGRAPLISSIGRLPVATQAQPAPQLPPSQPSALASLTAIVEKLAQPPSLQPATPERLVRTVTRTFSPQADTAPRLLAAFNPAATTTIYSAWAGVETPSSQVQVGAVRAKAALFASTFAGPPTVTQTPAGAIATFKVTDGGDGYKEGDTGTITGGGGTGAMYKVTGVRGEVVTKVTIDPAGSGYSVTEGAQTASGGKQQGSGKGLLIDILATTPVATTTTVSYPQPQNLSNTWTGLVGSGATPPTAVALDTVYDQIKVGSWVAIYRPLVDANDNVTGNKTTYHQVQAVQTQSMDTRTGFSAKVTLLTVNPPWLAHDTKNLANNLGSTAVLRGTVVYAQAETLDLAEEPLDRDVEGHTIELAELYDGLETGRWIIVSGERTDIPNTTGVTASELAMIAGVTQGSQAPLCATFPATDTTGAPYIPFAQIYYTTAPNTFGDRLMVGELAGDAAGYKLFLTLFPVPVPDPPNPNQQYCDQVQLAPGVYVNAYVPTAAERQGIFSDFEGLLVNPFTLSPYPGGQIPNGTQGTTDVLGQVFVFAWRISTQPVHTILTLANDLSYTYDSTTVTIYGNVAAATNGQSVGEVLGNGDASQAFLTFALHQSPLTYLSAATPAGAQSTLTVTVNEIEWQETDDLSALGPKVHAYTTLTDNSAQTTVIFGNGENGARVPTGTANVKAVYRYGIGSAGNVNAQQISQLATQPGGVQSVINPLPASGGADPDTASQARVNTPLAVKALDRLVSVQDYADFSRSYAGIGKAASVKLSNGRRQVVFITIAGAGDIPIATTSDLYNNLVQALQQFGDPHQPILVGVRRLKLLVICAGIQVLPAYQFEDVEPNVRSALLNTFGFDQRNLGQTAFLSEAISAMQAVQGVAFVNVTVFDSVAQDATATTLASLGTTLVRRGHVTAKPAYVDASLTLPANPTAQDYFQIQPAELVYLTPDIPDTLILTEITPTNPGPPPALRQKTKTRSIRRAGGKK